MPKPPAFVYSVYYENYLDEDSSETLKQWTRDSAYEAVADCLDPNVRADFLEVERGDQGEVLIENFSPYAVWGSWEKFHELLQIHILVIKTQLNLDISREQAAKTLIINAHENKRLAM